MISENKTKSANYLRIITVLKDLEKSQIISKKEYNKAKIFYQKLTGADIIIPD